MKIPLRHICSVLLIAAELAMILTITFLCDIYVPYFHIAVIATQVICVIRIVGSDENPDYKAPWALFVALVPIVGFMVYFMFYKRELSKRFVKRLKVVEDQRLHLDNEAALSELEEQDKATALQARLLCKIADTNVFPNMSVQFFPMGEDLFAQMLIDLKNAKSFIFLEYFIIQEGAFWNSILEILKEKAAQGIDVRVIYDDIGCMAKVKGNYYKTLRSYGIKAYCFARFRPQATNEFNSRSHRKLMIVDGKVGFTGGVNIADEYINETHPFGKWKDVGIRLEGAAVSQLTSTFLSDYEMNIPDPLEDFTDYLHITESSAAQPGCVIPFEDNPKPLGKYQVSKIMIMNLLNQATEYVYMMSPYLIIDNELCQAIENAALRGIDVRIITPHIPDKKIVFGMTRSYYKRLMDAGVRIFEYEPGFVHAKVYLSDDKYAIVGTINLDYRSLVHHFENGVWIYDHPVLRDIKQDFCDTQEVSLEQRLDRLNNNRLHLLIQSAVRVIAPLM